MLSRFNKTTVLNSAVSRFNFIIKREFKIAQFTILPNEKGISLGRILLCGLPKNCSILDAPEFRITFPTLRLLPSKSFFSAKMEEIKKKEDRMIGDIFIIS
jgi:hypothetical protein